MKRDEEEVGNKRGKKAGRKEKKKKSLQLEFCFLSLFSSQQLLQSAWL